MQRQRHHSRNSAPNMFQLRRAWKHTPMPWFLNDDLMRTTHILARAGVSEKNRQIKLENRSDAHERRVAARAKRARRNKAHKHNNFCRVAGLVDAAARQWHA